MNTKKYYGIVEGFFSDPLQPWTFEERSSTIRFISRYAMGINSYLYCPKNDPYVTTNPYGLYPKTKLQDFRDFVNLCDQFNIKFIYGLNPSLEVEEIRTIEKTIEIIVQKLRQILSVGVRDVCLLFDDIPIAYDVFSANSSFDAQYTKALTDIVNGVYGKINSEIDTFWFCSPDYNFLKETNLTKSLTLLNPNIRTFWTGNEIFTKKKRIKDLQRVKKITQFKKIVLWDNYPVNDAEQNQGYFNLNGFYPVSKTLTNELCGIFINPMREAYANFPFYITFSNWIQNPKIYKRKEAYQQALFSLDVPSNIKYAITILRQRNNFDMLSRNCTNRIFSKKISSRSDNPYGELFLESINPIILEWNTWVDLTKKLRSGILLTESDIAPIDIFPTRSDVPRYIIEISSIVKLRLKLLGYTRNPPELENKYEEILSLKDKYSGKEWLKMSRCDKDRAKKIINTLINFEQKKLLKKLNDQKIEVSKKKQLFYERKNINRFSI